MSMKHLSLVAALAVAASPSFAITVNMTDFTYTPPVAIGVTNTDRNGPGGYDGVAGQFAGTLGGGESQSRLGVGQENLQAGSFTAYCAQIGQDFFFGTTYDYTLVTGASYFGVQRSDDLARLFYAASLANFGFDAVSSAAMQAAIWEIIYEQGSYDLTTGNFEGSPENVAYRSAFNTVNGFLLNLGQYSDGFYKIDVLTNGDAQDFVVPTPVPEPETWALLVAGLGAIGIVMRRRKA